LAESTLLARTPRALNCRTTRICQRKAFFLLGAALAATGVGWFRPVFGDGYCIRGDFLRGGTGNIIAGALLLILLQSKVRTVFV
jgi:hypothetical protein